MAYASKSSSQDTTDYMDKVIKIFSSPSMRRKNASSSSSLSLNSATLGRQPAGARLYFGVTLDEIAKRESRDVPHLITKVCHYLYSNGLDQEGVFRVSGSARIVDQLRSEFDRFGDADLASIDDSMAVAGLLKLFLRELPDGIVSHKATAMCISAQEELASQKERCVEAFVEVFKHIPRPHYQTLKYIVRFLVLVTKRHELNKMSAMALGIIFGPTIFRCKEGIAGLREQGITNHITVKLITEYDAIFLSRGEMSPYNPKYVPDLKKGKVPPRRPPPPVIDSPPVPSPRKHRLRQQQDDGPGTEDQTSEDRSTPRSQLTTPRLSDEYLDSARAHSPIHLDSDRSEFTNHSGLMGLEPTPTELVVQAISSTVNQHLFGNTSTSVSSDEGSPVPAPRHKHKKRKEQSLAAKVEASVVRSAVEDNRGSRSRNMKFEVDEETADLRGAIEVEDLISGTSTDEKKAPHSSSNNSVNKVQDMSSRLVSGEERVSSELGQLNVHIPDDHTKPQRAVEERRDVVRNGEELDFGTIERNHSTLNTFKRAPGPKNRRSPTRSKPPPGTEEDGEEGNDLNHNQTKTSFLQLHPRPSGPRPGGPAPDRTDPHKPYIPPLDLSILHEHGDGSEPIPAEQGMSLSLQKAHPFSQESGAMLSPRSSKVKKNNRDNTDVPPSPPTEQTLFSSSKREEEHSQQIKQLTKKIQSCKRKIKLFEDSFEREHGYRPSQTDKAAKPEVKKYVQELAKARKQLRKVKEEHEFDKLMMSGMAETPPSDLRPDPVSSEQDPPTMESSLHALQSRLSDRRVEMSRPEDITLMTREQIQTEKIDVQKELLQFESVHGRPSTKAQKELMRPLYDHYRNIKRLLSKPPSPREMPLELQAVPEDSLMDFTSSASTKEGVSEEEFSVTRDPRLLQSAIDSSLYSPVDEEDGDELSPDRTPPTNLHQFSVTELQDEQKLARQKKIALRRQLRQFEDEFFQRTGRKVVKEERTPLETEYLQYKQVKARLKLLEALLSKHDPLAEALS